MELIRIITQIIFIAIFVLNFFIFVKTFFWPLLTIKKEDMYYYLVDGMTAIIRTDFKKPSNEDSKEFQEWRDEVETGDKRTIFYMTSGLIEYMTGMNKKDWDEVFGGKDFILQTMADLGDQD